MPASFFEHHSPLASQDGLKVTLGPRLTRFQGRHPGTCGVVGWHHQTLLHKSLVIAGFPIGDIAEVFLPLLGRQVPSHAGTGLGDEVVGSEEMAARTHSFTVMVYRTRPRGVECNGANEALW